MGEYSQSYISQLQSQLPLQTSESESQDSASRPSNQSTGQRVKFSYNVKDCPDKYFRQLSQGKKRIDKQEQQEEKTASLITYLCTCSTTPQKKKIESKIKQVYSKFFLNKENIKKTLQQRKLLYIPEELRNKMRRLRSKSDEQKYYEENIQSKMALAKLIQNELKKINNGKKMHQVDKDHTLNQFTNVLNLNIQEIQRRNKNRWLNSQKKDFLEEKKRKREDLECKILQLQNTLIYSEFNDQNNSISSKYRTRVKQSITQQLQPYKNQNIIELKRLRELKVKELEDKQAQLTLKLKLKIQQFQTSSILKDLNERKKNLQEKKNQRREQWQKKWKEIYENLNNFYKNKSRKLSESQESQKKAISQKQQSIKKKCGQNLEIALKTIRSQHQAKKAVLYQQKQQKEKKITYQRKSIIQHRQIIREIKQQIYNNQRQIYQLQKQLHNEKEIFKAQQDSEVRQQLRKSEILYNSIKKSEQLVEKLKKKMNYSQYLLQIQQQLQQVQDKIFKAQFQYQNNIIRQKTKFLTIMKQEMAKFQEYYRKSGNQLYSKKKESEQQKQKKKLTLQNQQKSQKKALEKQQEKYWQDRLSLTIEIYKQTGNIYQKNKIPLSQCQIQYFQEVQSLKKQKNNVNQDYKQKISQCKRIIIDKIQNEYQSQIQKYQNELKQFKKREDQLQISFRQQQQQKQKQQEKQTFKVREMRNEIYKYLSEWFYSNNFQRIKLLYEQQLKILKQSIESTQKLINTKEEREQLQTELKSTNKIFNQRNNKLQENIGLLKKMKLLEIKLKKQQQDLSRKAEEIDQDKQKRKKELIKKMLYFNKRLSSN